jgi:hypothetical protein
MSYKSWELRREILSELHRVHVRGDWSEHDAFAYSIMMSMLIIVEHVDWNTGKKIFASKTHLENWLKHLAEVSSLNERNGWEHLKNSLDYMIQYGFASFDKGTKTLSLHMPQPPQSAKAN